MPRPAATAHPITIPTTGAHSRTIAEDLRARAATTVRVIRAVRGAATGSCWDASSSRPKTTDASVIERIIITVPPTIGVTMRLRMNSHLDMMIWTIAETIIKVVSVAGPPSTSAVMQNGMEKAAVNRGRTARAPTGPSCRTWISVATPTAMREANTTHVRYASSRPDAFATMMGVTSSVADAIRPNCRP